MTKKNLPLGYVKHLAKIDKSLRAVDQSVATLQTAIGHADNAVEVTFQFLFDHLNRGEGKELSLPQVKMAASIIYNLVQSMQKLKAIKQAVKEEVGEVIQLTTSEDGLPAEMLDQLEKELKLF